MKQIRILTLLLFISVLTIKAQVLEPVKWKFDSKSTGNGEYELLFTAKIDAGWHMYGLNIPGDGPVPTSFNFIENKEITYINNVTPGKQPEVKFDPTFEMNVELFSNEITFSRKVKIPDGTTSKVEGAVEFMVCDDTKCLPPKEVEFSFNLGTDKDKKATETKTEKKDNIQALNNTPAITTDSVKTDVTYVESDTLAPVRDTVQSENRPVTPGNDRVPGSLLRLFLLAFLAGFGALLTPCVFPIIPLTVGFFMRNTQRTKAIFNALMFGLSIVFIYTSVGFLVGILNIDLVRLISSHWLPNLIFLMIFVALAISFFGVFEITLPGSLSNKIDHQADKGGFLGPFFVALATVVISFSCTGPIVGVVLGSALQGELIKPVVGMFGFSLSFALPFTLLAIFPKFLRNLPKSGGWLNTVKVFIAFFLLQFSLVFLVNLRIPFFTREVILSISIVLLILLGLNILGKLRFSNDSPLENITVPRLFISIFIFSIALYLITGLFGAPLKRISPFLPESNYTFNTKAVALNQGIAGNICDENPKYSDFLDLPLGLVGYHDYDEALACASILNKPVLLDFAGHSCKNCKKMYAEVWSDPRVLEKLRNDFVIAVLYTDDRTKLAEEDWVTSKVDGKVKNTVGKKFNDLQIEKFGSNALPLYAIVDAQGNIATDVSSYAYSSDVDAFLDFLEDGLNN